MPPPPQSFAALGTGHVDLDALWGHQHLPEEVVVLTGPKAGRVAECSCMYALVNDVKLLPWSLSK